MGEGESNNHPKEGEEDHPKIEAKQHNPEESEGTGEGIRTPKKEGKDKVHSTCTFLTFLFFFVLVTGN